MSDEPTVYVVDDDSFVRDALRRLIESEGFRVETFAATNEFLNRTPEQGPACLVLDMQMPGMNGLELQARLSEQGTTLSVIIITGYGDVRSAVRAIKGGAIDFLEKPFDNNVLLDRIREAIETDRQRRKEQAAARTIQLKQDRLTKREMQVMDLVVTGLANKQIAAQLHLSTKTIEIHRAQVMRKMEAASLPALVRMSSFTSPHDSGVGNKLATDQGH